MSNLMDLSPSKRRALAADRAFRKSLRAVLADPKQFRGYSTPRRYYIEVMVRAFTWWLDGGHKDHPPEPAGPEDYSPRDRILVLFLAARPDEDSVKAIEARDAQAAHMDGGA